MKLSISNIAWDKENDQQIYRLMNDNNFSGLEIAPTRWIAEHPYDNALQARNIADDLFSRYKFKISSMQSIWFGKTENLFGSESEREVLLNYTKKAIDFARSISCPNLVFGSPKNRNNTSDKPVQEVYDFFEQIASYAELKGTKIGLEPNPGIYGTNFITTTKQAIDFVKEIAHKSLGVNVDLGTVIQNKELTDVFLNDLDRVTHIHLSEPFLEPLKERILHKELAYSLKHSAYDRYVSIEMKNTGSIGIINDVIKYISNLFL